MSLINELNRTAVDTQLSVKTVALYNSSVTITITITIEGVNANRTCHESMPHPLWGSTIPRPSDS